MKLEKKSKELSKYKYEIEYLSALLPVKMSQSQILNLLNNNNNRKYNQMFHVLDYNKTLLE